MVVRWSNSSSSLKNQVVFKTKAQTQGNLIFRVDFFCPTKLERISTKLELNQSVLKGHGQPMLDGVSLDPDLIR